MFFSKRKMNFEPYVSQKEQEVSEEASSEELEQSTPMENEPEVAAAELTTSTVQETAAENQVAEQETAGTVVNEYVEPAPVEEETIVEEPSPYAEAAVAESYYFSSYEEAEPKVEDTPASSVIEENNDASPEKEADLTGLEIPKVEDIFAKERNQMEYEVIIGKNTTFKGEINIDGATRIDGRIEGTVCVNNDMFIGETGHIEGEIKVINATISGTIVGNIKCSNRLELLSTSSISGDIECGALIVAEGASINATVACGKAVAGSAPAPAEAAPVVE